jgi:hypothetical protein
MQWPAIAALLIALYGAGLSTYNTVSHSRQAAAD